MTKEALADQFPRYRSHKIVRAARIESIEGNNLALSWQWHGDQIDGTITVDPKMFARYTPKHGDYYVVYDSNYASISPAAEFLAGYKLVPTATMPAPKVGSISAAADGLAVDDAIAASVQKGERVSLADMESLIVAENWFTAGDALKAMGKGTMPPHGLLTICVLVLKNGWTLTGTSACADPANFNADVGRKFARKDALSKLWPLEAYVLRTNMHERGA